jgi:hypothetical protein
MFFFLLTKMLPKIIAIKSVHKFSPKSYIHRYRNMMVHVLLECIKRDLNPKSLFIVHSSVFRVFYFYGIIFYSRSPFMIGLKSLSCLEILCGIWRIEKRRYKMKEIDDNVNYISPQDNQFSALNWYNKLDIDCYL